MTDDIENVELEESTDPAPPMEELPPEESAPAEEPGADEQPPSEPEAGESAPVEVISVDELLERLTSSGEPEEGEEVSEPDEAADGESVPEEPEEALPSVLEVTGEGGRPLVVQDMEGAAQSLEALQETALHPALTTPFEDYTVTEALLLLILLAVFLSACAKLLRGAFTWLRS